MFLTILFLLILIIGLILIHFSKESVVCDILSIVSIVVGGICLITCIISIMNVYCKSDQVILNNEITYNKIMKQIEIVNCDYEDVSKLKIIDDVYEWNRKVESYIYWSQNPWTSWFVDKDVVQNLKRIDINSIEFGGERK